MNSEWLKFNVWKVKGNCSWNELKRIMRFVKESERVDCGEKETVIYVRWGRVVVRWDHILEVEKVNVS